MKAELVLSIFSLLQDELQRIIKEVEAAIEKQNDSLNSTRESPEIYRDPLTLFDLRLR